MYRKIEQNNILLIPLKYQLEKIPHLSFNPNFTLQAGDQVWIKQGGNYQNPGTTGTLLDANMQNERFSSLDEPRKLHIELNKPLNIKGFSGSEVILVKTGQPTG